MKSSKFEQDKRLYAALLIGGVLIMLATLYFGAINSKAEARKAAEKDIADLKKQCNYYDDFLSADEVKSLSRLAEQIENIADVLDIMSESERSRFLRRYIGNDRVSCILILDEDLKPDSDYPEVMACYNEWSAEVSESAIADIIRYPRKIYSARIKHDSRTYDIAATARKDKTGVVFSAVLQNDEDLEQSYDSVRSLLGANETALGGLLYITKDNELVGSNTDNKSVDKHEADELNAYIAQKTDGDLTRFRCNGKIYYGAGAKYREYEVFVFYPSVEVYSGCRIALLVTFTLCIITSFLIITAYYHSRISHNREIERKNDIITTISGIYLLTVAIDLRKGTYTLLKYPREWGNVAAQGSADAAFYESLVNSAAAEFREGYRRFSDPGTLDERIREGGYLEYDYQNIRGEWQSDRIIPQDRYENGNLASFILVSKSTNEQKKAELKNQEKLKAAMKAEQTANQSKTDLLRRISHDTRTPINVILGMIEEFPYAIRLVSEVVSSNGSTSQASVCGSTLALMDAGVPITAPVAGISCGLITDDDGSWATMIDIQGLEDFFGDMDFKVAGTKKGITAIQMDLKIDGLTPEIIRNALETTRKGRLYIIDDIILPCIPEPRSDVSKYAPKMISTKIEPDKIREVIGTGGKVIQKICADTGAQIDIEDDGSVFIAAVDKRAAYKALDIINAIVSDPEPGAIYTGKVTGIIPIGCFVEYAPGKEGLVHISKLDTKRVEKVEDVVHIGDEIKVMVLGVDNKGRINLSRRDALEVYDEEN